MAATTCVILSGGTGTRLWPLSRISAPKQLQKLLGSQTLLEATAARIRHLNSPILIVANTALLEDIKHSETVPPLGVHGPTGARVCLVGEPVGRNTAPAVAAAALLSHKDDVLLVLAADHHIQDQDAFRVAIERGVEAAARGRLVTFGIVPTGPETGFGYIAPARQSNASNEQDRTASDDKAVREIERFVEKPNHATASELIESGALWNSGMFAFSVGLLLQEFERHAPEILQRVEEAIASSVARGDRIELGPEFADAPALSIDVAIMEKTDRGSVIDLDAGWSDVGSWGTLWEMGPQDESGNVTIGDVVKVDSSGSYLRSDGPAIATIGVEDLVVVATSDAVLVVPRDRVQEVKGLVDLIAPLELA